MKSRNLSSVDLFDGQITATIWSFDDGETHSSHVLIADGDDAQVFLSAVGIEVPGRVRSVVAILDTTDVDSLVKSEAPSNTGDPDRTVIVRFTGEGSGAHVTHEHYNFRVDRVDWKHGTPKLHAAI